MGLRRVQKQRTGLLEFLIILIIILSGLIVVLSHFEVRGNSISILAIISLFSCLYVLSKERSLKLLEAQLVKMLIDQDHQIDKLGHDLEEGYLELELEKGKAEYLDGHLQEITSLYRAISVVNGEAGGERIAGTGLRAALDLVGGNRGSVMLLDAKKRYLYVVSALGIDATVVRTTKQKSGHGVAGWVAQFGEPIRLTGNAQDDERFVNPNEMSEDVKSAMCVPLRLGNEIIGVMNLGTTEEGHEFTDHHMRLATIFGQHVSVPIANAMLMKKRKG